MKRKSEYKLPPRTPEFASKQTCAAEFEVSVDTWDDWVRSGLVPKPYVLGSTSSILRWKWDEVCACIQARGKTGGAQENPDFNIDALRGKYGGKREREAKNNRNVPA